MTIILLGVAIAILCQIGYSTYKESKANKRLNEIYQHRKEREDRRRRLIDEKPDNIILVSDLWNVNAKSTINFVGKFSSLSDAKAKDGDLAIVADLYYIYKDGKWYELVDDVSHLNGIKY